MQRNSGNACRLVCQPQSRRCQCEKMSTKVDREHAVDRAVGELFQICRPEHLMLSMSPLLSQENHNQYLFSALQFYHKLSDADVPTRSLELSLASPAACCCVLPIT